MRRFIITSNILLIAISFIACTQKLHTGSDPVCSFTPQYLRIVDTLGYRRVDVLSPWQGGELLSRLYVVKHDSVVTPADAPRVRVPISRMALTSATQIGFLHQLKATDCVCALSTPHLIYNTPAHACVDIGEDFNLNMEALLLSDPSLVLMTNYGAPLTNIDRIRKAGVPVLEVVEWVEQSPLSRAAWIQLYGVLTDRETMADSIFYQVRTAYTEQMAACTAVSQCHIVTGQSYRGTWYVPTGATYMGRLIGDAGAEYAFAADTTKASLPLTLEQALTTFADADVWIGVNATSLAELKAVDEKHAWMKSYQSGRVFNFANRTTPTGGNDFWETGIVHPEYILRDIQWALDTTQIPNYQPYFICRLR